MKLFLLSLLLLSQATEVPFRAKEDYQIELKYSLKQRPAQDHNTVILDPSKVEDRKLPGALPYLIVNVKILNPKENEYRFKCETNLGNTVFNRKAEKSLVYAIDMGYIDDLKDRVTAHTYTLFALTEEKDAINKIVLHVEEDGTFLINGEKRGKF